MHDVTDEADYEWVILDFAIFTPFRRNGFGSTFVRDIIKFCESKSVHRPCKIEASSHVDNKTALKFWNKNGFLTIVKNVKFSQRKWLGSYDINLYKSKSKSKAKSPDKEKELVVELI